MARVRAGLGGWVKAAVFTAVFLVAATVPAPAAPSPVAPDKEPAALMSLQDQCLSRAERSAAPGRMRAICIGWALLAVENGGAAAAKARALKDTCLREVRFGADGQIREYRSQGEALCNNLFATVAP